MSPIASSPPKSASSSSPIAGARAIYAQHGHRASTADLAVILIDARKGVLPQTRRHSYLCNLIGIRNIVLAVNKMDLVDYSQRLRRDRRGLCRLRQPKSASRASPMPISGFKGDNITAKSRTRRGTQGKPLIEHLETVEIDVTAIRQAVPPAGAVGQPPQSRFPGLLRADRHRHGEARRCGPRAALGQDLDRHARIVTLDGDLDEAVAGQSVTLCFADEIDCSRGDVIAIADTPPEAPTSLKHARLDGRRAAACRPRLLAEARHADGVRDRPAPKYTVNVNTMEHLAAKTLELNAIGVAELATDKPIVFEAYAAEPHAGRLHPDRQDHQPHRGAGMLHFSLRRAQNVHWQALDISRDAHARSRTRSPPCCGSPGFRVRANRPSPT
jgi:bifunctional enzyme CysN/CysC